jgi:putative membrane protein
MTTTTSTPEEKAVALTKYIISLPSIEYFFVAILIIGALFGIGINMHKHSGVELFLKGSYDGIMLLSVPALICTAFTKMLARQIPLKRIVATAVVTETLYALTYLISMILSTYAAFYAELSLFLGAGVIFLVWYVIGRLVFILKLRSAFFAIIQLFIHLLFLFNSGIIVFEKGPINAIPKFYIVSFIFLGALYMFFLIINAPMKKSFGISSTDAFSMFVAQWLYQNKDLEEALENVGKKARTILSFLAFDRGKDKVFFVIPCVHFGPFGNLGGSEFSYLIANELDKKGGSTTFVFHGTATHDLNPVSSKELDNIIRVCEESIKEAKYEKAEISFNRATAKECIADVLNINDCAFVGLTRAPYITEDINFGLGLAMMAEGEKYRKLVIVADQHNAETGEITTFEPGDEIGFNYIEAIKKALTEKKLEKNKLMIGISKRAVDLPFIGSGGIKTAVFSSTPEYALILIDANGITPQFYERIISEVKNVGKQYNKNLAVAVYTTDTHEINIIRGGLNPVKEEWLLLKEIKTSVAEAILDMKEARFFATKKWFDINVLGSKQSIEIISTVNSIVAVAKIVAPVILIGASLIIMALLLTI